MVDVFLNASINAVQRNGVACTYVKVQTGTYDVETGSTTGATETSHSVVMYKKHLKTNQYSFPNLIGKDVGVFYLANSELLFTPAVKDKIVFDSQTYLVDSFENCMAHGQIVLFKIVAVRS
jgi:hypothetical protein